MRKRIFQIIIINAFPPKSDTFITMYVAIILGGHREQVVVCMRGARGLRELV